MPGQSIVIPGDLRTRLWLIFLILTMAVLSVLLGVIIGASIAGAL
jgi:hypothetical protein